MTITEHEWCSKNGTAQLNIHDIFSILLKRYAWVFGDKYKFTDCISFMQQGQQFQKKSKVMKGWKRFERFISKK